MSRIGKRVIQLPEHVTIEQRDGLVTVVGPKGRCTTPVSPELQVVVKEKALAIRRRVDTASSRAAHGLTRTLLMNMVKGTTEGFVRQLEIEGVGFRAQVEKNRLLLYVGFSHAVQLDIPEGVTVETPKPIQVVVRGSDAAAVGDLAARIRAVFPAEPYKGKGIRYLGEVIRRKAGKVVAGTKGKAGAA